MKRRFLAAAAVLLWVIVLQSGIGKIVSVPAFSYGGPQQKTPVILIDPGHGGPDGGAVGPNGILEKDLNLAIGSDLADLFRMTGFSVIMTRSDDRSIHDDGVTGLRAQKISDLHNRLALAQQYSDGILLSIHQNQFSQSRYCGGQVFYGRVRSELSRQLALRIQDQLKTLLQPDNNRRIKETYDTIYLMKKAPCIAVLTECGFLSNPEEASLLTQPDYQRKMAFVIYTAALQFLQEETTYGN